MQSRAAQAGKAGRAPALDQLPNTRRPAVDCPCRRSPAAAPDLTSGGRPVAAHTPAREASWIARSAAKNMRSHRAYSHSPR